MRCRAARQRLPRAIDQELGLEERLRLDAHLADCAECAAEHARLLLLEETVARLPDPPLESVELEAAVSAIGAAIAERAGEAPAPFVVEESDRVWPRRVLWVAVAAAIVFAVLVPAILRFTGGDEAPVQDARPIAVTPERAPATAVETGIEVVGSDTEFTPREVEDELRSQLLASFRGSADAVDVTEQARRFDERTLAIRSWPLVRIAERLLARTDDPEVARATVRYLGARGDRLSVSVLRAELERPEVAPAAVRALADLGAWSVPALDEALRDGELMVLALHELGRVGGPEAARAIERAAVRSALEGDASFAVARTQHHLQALSEMGEDAVEPFLRLAATELFRSGELHHELLDQLSRVEGGGAAFVRILDSARGRHDAELCLEVAALLQPEGALGWLQERACEYRFRDLALDALARWDGAAPLAALQRLDVGGCVPDEDLVRTFRSLADRDGGRLADLARTLVAGRDALGLERFLELCVTSAHPAAARALVPIALSGLLSEDQRQWAALAVGELGDAAEAQLLLRGLEQLGADEKRLYAAILLTVHRHLGGDGVLAALNPPNERPARHVQRVLDALEEASGSDVDARTVALFRVARALDDVLLPNPPRIANSL